MNALAYTVGSNVVFGNGQYKPETNGGRKLLAHELTHTIQQGHALGNITTLHRRPDAGVDTSVPHPQPLTDVSGGTAPGNPSLRQDIETNQFEGILLSTNVPFLHYQLEQYIVNHGEQGAVDFVERFEASLRKQRVDLSDMSGVTEKSTALGESIRQNEAILPILQDQLRVLRNENEQFLSDFETEADLTLASILASSEERITAERERYGLSHTLTPITGHHLIVENRMANNVGSRGLTIAARELAGKLRQLRAMVEERKNLEYVYPTDPEADFPVNNLYISDQARYDALGSQIKDTQREYALLRNEKERDYPILASFTPYASLAYHYLDTTIEALTAIASGPSASLAGTLYADIEEKLRNIQSVRKAFVSGDLKIWKLPSIITITENQMQVHEGSVRYRIVKDKINQVESVRPSLKLH